MLNHPRILVCTDFSEYSDLALLMAEELRKKSHGSVHVLHLSEFPLDWDWLHDEGDSYYMDDKLKNIIEMDIKKKLERQIKQCGVEATSQVISGYPFTYINDLAKEKKSDVIVLGYKGRAQTPLAIGGVVEKLVSTSKVPVLVVKKSLPIEKMTVLVDPNYKMDRLINTGEEYASLLSSKFGILSLWKDVSELNPDLSKMGIHYVDSNITAEQKKDLLHKISAILKSHVARQLECDVRVEFATDKKMAYQIMNLLNEDTTDMIVMERHQKKILERIFIGSEARRLLELFQGNLLVLPV